ncbi:metal-dependent hydrolase family protein [Aquamicrobium soli]|uniref:Amidohydrolase family protein n=1 Tax=Aquamicrobium soli TaxID=1811518 RepID=A0ABV7K7I0_9HYPH
MSVVTLANAFLIDCTGSEPKQGASVIIENGRIRDILDASAAGSGDVIDLGGKTLMPGLIDAHVHACAVQANPAEQHRNLPPSYIAVQAMLKLEQMLQMGFTTVRDAGGADFGFRQAVEDGHIKGPRMKVSGNHLYQTGGHGDKRRPAELCTCVAATDVGLVGAVADGPHEMRKAVRENLRRHADQIKLMCSGGAMSPGDELDVAQFTLEEIRVAVEEATAANRYVMAHAYSGAAVMNAARAGVRSIEHGNLITEEAAIAVRDADAWLVPTLAVYEALSRHGKEFNIPPFQLQKVEAARNSGLRGLEIAYRAGLKIGTGTDLLGTMVKYQPMELELKAEIMTPMESLLSATRTNAELMRMADLTGTVEPGKYADLIVVDGNPLKEIALFQDPARMLMVMKAGRIYRNLL